MRSRVGECDGGGGKGSGIKCGGLLLLHHSKRHVFVFLGWTSL